MFLEVYNEILNVSTIKKIRIDRNNDDDKHAIVIYFTDGRSPMQIKGDMTRADAEKLLSKISRAMGAVNINPDL